ncbi:hypothetical protein BX616_003424 [Lobosporangium transversale]|nr:hypothetical protein BX616_003424 [Lobosporangium transversale]
MVISTKQCLKLCLKSFATTWLKWDWENASSTWAAPNTVFTTQTGSLIPVQKRVSYENARYNYRFAVSAKDTDVGLVKAELIAHIELEISVGWNIAQQYGDHTILETSPYH